MRLIGPILALMLAAQPALAKPPGLVVKMGETWIFSVAHGQPARARKAAVKAMPAAGEMKVSLSALMGTTMTITNNSRFDYAYKATLILPDGKAGAAKSCAVPANGKLAIEHWPKAVAAIRLGDFKRAPAGSLCP
ncbi:hypothetical protein LZ518_07305 [Sphingomonas sp. RB56-2]|uniref:Uncharacterized protein n=1 Tax=Sphingomonas brevis TaxID=2908206 RepID=A0ABT0S946_9SPHN|nr:hypothetical protein [Sphingomonas brevis]MCL6740936.1 hypothetical protein [Sphingomonas brevis]